MASIDKKILYIGDYEELTSSVPQIPMGFVCHTIKDGDPYWVDFTIPYIIEAWLTLFPHLEEYTLIPIPSRKGNVEQLALRLARRLHSSISFCLKRTNLSSVYDKKKKGIHITIDDIPLEISGPVPTGKILLVDNVVATGTTLNKCYSLFGKTVPCLAIAVDLKTFDKHYGE